MLHARGGVAQGVVCGKAGMGSEWMVVCSAVNELGGNGGGRGWDARATGLFGEGDEAVKDS